MPAFQQATALVFAANLRNGRTASISSSGSGRSKPSPFRPLGTRAWGMSLLRKSMTCWQQFGWSDRDQLFMRQAAQVLSDRELWDCVNDVLRQRGSATRDFVASPIGALVSAGDLEGVRVWKEIARRAADLMLPPARGIKRAQLAPQAIMLRVGWTRAGRSVASAGATLRQLRRGLLGRADPTCPERSSPNARTARGCGPGFWRAGLTASAV